MNRSLSLNVQAAPSRQPCHRIRVAVAFASLLFAVNAFATSVLFVGNSFTFGYGSPVRFFGADTVTDLNKQGIGGVPALFKAFAVEAGLAYDVYLETQGGVGIDWHLEHKSGVIGQRPWDVVVVQSFSTLDVKKPGDPARLIGSAKQLAALLQRKNPLVDMRLLATWPRADEVYESKGTWYGKSLEAMAKDVRDGYEAAAAASPVIKGVIPVGDAWVRAIRTGMADANPYDGIDAGKLDLWTYDNHHASVYGYYLEALVVFGSVTGNDPRTLGKNECAGFELGLARAQVGALQQVAFDQLAVSGAGKPAPLKPAQASELKRCSR